MASSSMQSRRRKLLRELIYVIVIIKCNLQWSIIGNDSRSIKCRVFDQLAVLHISEWLHFYHYHLQIEFKISYKAASIFGLR